MPLVHVYWMTELILISLSYPFRICNLPLNLSYTYFLLELFLCVFISCFLELMLKLLQFLWSRVSTGDVPCPLTHTHDIPGLTCLSPSANNETVHTLDDKHVTYSTSACHTHTHSTDLPHGDPSLPAMIRVDIMTTHNHGVFLSWLL